MKNLIVIFSFILPKYLLAAEIVLGINSLPTAHLNIFSRSTNQTQALRQIYEPPFLVDENSKLQSPYFSSWEAKSDGKVYEFVVKEGLKFSNGKSVGVEDLTSVFNRRNPDGGQLLQDLENVEAKGTLIRVRLRHSTRSLPEKLSDLSYAIISTEKENGFPVGTGAFKINSSGEKQITLFRNSFHRDFIVGNLQQIQVKLLDKSSYTVEEIRKEKIDFFPLIQIKDIASGKPKEFKRVVYPSHRVNLMVLNINSQRLRTLISKCIHPKELLEMPYFKDSAVAYNSIVPSGVENYNPNAKEKTLYDPVACSQDLKKWKQKKTLRWLNVYVDDSNKNYVELMVSRINEVISPIKVELQHKPLNEAQQVLSRGEFDIFVCGVGSPYPLAEGILSDFIYSSTDKNKLIKYEDVTLKRLFAKYQNSETAKRSVQIQKIVSYLINKAWVIPFARRIDTFLIPENWKNLSMVNSMNGNFYLGKVHVGKD